ncbi:unnamed protein product [Didymodactylos carnosus]|uniref:Uncharacterized protein n=1 Tax=Didymodactylos carnosus TaxID=1234261 RepID=A0A8S2EQI8_9BILA|nr:unnamed protein product [Didymodactylos carnosus]CAF4035035.1 unnamed protein product [Didymodactylos carnosus]
MELVCTTSNDYPYWEYTKPIVATVTGYNAFPSLNETLSGNCGFWGGKVNDPSGALYQYMDLKYYSRLIDSSAAHFELSAFVGGIESDGDYSLVSVGFRSSDNKQLGVTSLEIVTNIHRNNRSGLLLRRETGIIPKYSKVFGIAFEFMKMSDGPYNNGLADDIQLIIRPIEHINKTFDRVT